MKTFWTTDITLSIQKELLKTFWTLWITLSIQKELLKTFWTTDITLSIQKELLKTSGLQKLFQNEFCQLCWLSGKTILTVLTDLRKINQNPTLINFSLRFSQKFYFLKNFHSFCEKTKRNINQNKNWPDFDRFFASFFASFFHLFFFTWFSIFYYSFICCSWLSGPKKGLEWVRLGINQIPIRWCQVHTFQWIGIHQMSFFYLLTMQIMQREVWK